MKKINKFILTLFFVLSTIGLHSNNNEECPIILLANDISSSGTEFKTLIKNPEIFNAWSLLNKESPTLRTNIEELKLVSNKLDEINKAGGYIKWKAIVNDSKSLPSSLVSLIKQDGAHTFQAWIIGKTLIYKPSSGQSLSGISAQTKIFQDIENSIGDKKVLETLEDSQHRLLFVLERPGQTNQFLALHPVISGEFKITLFQPAYNSNLNPNIPVPTSINKLVPDYKGTVYMHPDNTAYITQNNGNGVLIEMQGTRAKDFSESFKKLGIKASDAINYNWHHMDDFQIINDKAYCTMQLVLSEGHGGSGITGMAHSG